MDCSEIQSQLSAYYDGELGNADSVVVAAHLESCATCTEKIAGFVELTELKSQLTEPLAPAHLWEDIVGELERRERTSVLPAPAESRATRHSAKLLAVAAGFLIMLIAGLVINHVRGGKHHHLAANFDAYLAEFAINPETAHNVLLAKYDGRETSVENAISTLKYEPRFVQGMPDGCSVSDVYMLNMPCCKCTMALAKFADGRTVAIFEHDENQPVWFGDRPQLDCICDDVRTGVVQMGDQLAATWKQGARYITVIGARDLEEVTRFVASLNGPGPKA